MNHPSDAVVDHAPWNILLTQYVDTNGRVAYRNLQEKDATTFARYLTALAQARFYGLSEAEEKALWINAYNVVIWFAQDFIDHAGSVTSFRQRFVTDDKKSIVERLSSDLKYLAYNWTLNAQDGQRIP